MTGRIPEPDRGRRWAACLTQQRACLDRPVPMVVEGKLTRMVGLTLEAVGCQAAIGGRCEVVVPNGDSIEAEVVGFAGDRLYLMPTGNIHGLTPNARVIPSSRVSEARVGDALLGRVLDGAGNPLDGGACRAPVCAYRWRASPSIPWRAA